MEEEFKPGDTVRVRSGGPTMTVASVEDVYGTQTAFCHWFDGKRPDQGSFPTTILLKVDPNAGAGGIYFGSVTRA